MEKKIIEDLKCGHFVITVHAALRMSKREVTIEDIKEVGRTVISLKNQELPNAPYKIRGRDLEGEVMEVICDYCDEVLIVTVLTKEELS